MAENSIPQGTDLQSAHEAIRAMMAPLEDNATGEDAPLEEASEGEGYEAQAEYDDPEMDEGQDTEGDEAEEPEETSDRYTVKVNGEEIEVPLTNCCTAIPGNPTTRGSLKNWLNVAKRPRHWNKRLPQNARNMRNFYRVCGSSYSSSFKPNPTGTNCMNRTPSRPSDWNVSGEKSKRSESSKSKLLTPNSRGSRQLASGRCRKWR